MATVGSCLPIVGVVGFCWCWPTVGRYRPACWPPRQECARPDGTPELAEVRGDRLAGGVTDEVDYRITDIGRSELAALGVVLPTKLGAVRCYDHIAGRLGQALAEAFDTAGWTEPASTHRALRVTDTGAAALREYLGISWPPPTPTIPGQPA